MPDGVLVQIAAANEAVVLRLSLARTTGTVVAEGDALAREDDRGEIVVAFDTRGVVALGDEDAVSGGFHLFRIVDGLAPASLRRSFGRRISSKTLH